MEPRAPIYWGEFSQAGLSTDVTRAMRLIEKQSSRANASVKFSNGVAEHDETIHDRAIWNQRYFAFIPPHAPLVEQGDAKVDFKCLGFMNIVQKQWTLPGFLQHSSDNTINVWNNKTSATKILHKDKIVFNIWLVIQAHFCTWTKLLF